MSGRMQPFDAPSDLESLPTCACNGEALDLVVVAPRVGPFPELRTFRCSECGHVVTLESENG